MTQGAVRLRISGRVQGVGYRAWTVDRATALGLRGWVRNRADGSVEAVLIGDETAVQAMIDACRTGPRFARVTDVSIEDAENDGSFRFEPRPTI